MIDSATGQRAESGLFSSLRRALGNILELIYTRLELLGVDFEARLHSSLQILLWSVAAFFSACLALLMLAVTILIAFWDTHRLLAAMLITLFFAGLAVAGALMVRYRMRNRPRVLAATIAELKRDAAALGEPL